MKQLSRKCVALLLTLMLLVSNIGIVALGEETVQPAEPAHVHTSDETAFLVLNGVDTDGAEAPAAVQEAEEAPAAEEPQEAPAAEEAPVAEEAPEAPAAEEPAAEPAQPQAEPEEKPAENMDPIEQAIQQAVAEAEQDLIRIAQEASVQQEPAPAEPAEEAPQAEEAADEAPQAEEAKEEEIADEAPEAEEAEDEEIADEAPDAEVAEEEEIADEAPDAEEAEEEEIADEAPDAEEAEEEEIVDEAPDAEEAEEEEIVDEAPEAEEAEEEEIADEAPEAEEIEEEEAIEDEAPIVTEEMTEEVPGDVTDDPAAALGGDDCTHDNAYERSFEYRYEYDDVDNSVHTTHEIYVATIYCPDCDQIIGTREEEMNTWQSSHEWDENGVCPLCGRINTCTHGWTTTREYWVDEEAVQTVYQDELYHKSIGTAVVYTHCWDCGMDYNRATVENYEMDYVSVHEWDDNNVCTICGETNTCQHPRYSFEYNWLDEENNQYRPLDESRHTVIGKAEHYSVCSQCGAKFDVTISDNYQISSWHNWGDDSVCTTCGYTCQHLNTWSYWEWIEQQTAQDTGSDYQHQMTGKVRIQIYCSSCGTTIETIEKEVSTNLEHNYNGGTCAACGHVCNHPDLTTEYYTEDGYEAVTTPVDSLHHKTVVTYAAHEHEYCPLCGYSQDTGESTIVSEEHVRSHGYDREEKKCTACGYEFDSCPHLDIYEYVEDWKDVKYQQAGTTDYHRVIGTAVVVYKCYQCGETVSTLTVNNYEANEPHDFNSDGVCVDCGMVDKYHCTHSKTHTSHYLYAAFPTYTYLDLKSHQVTGDFVYQEICDICGTTLSRTLKTNVTEQEEHEWLDEGVCRYCAAINECPHENAIELRYNDSSEILVTEIDGQLYEVYDQVTHKYCPDCGRNFGEQTKRVQVPHQHTWKGQKCIMCGAINTCTHDGTFEVTGELWQESTRTYQRNDDKTHIVSGEGYYYLQCSVCGLKVNKDREEGKVEIQEEHTFKDGVCTRCGQKEAVQAPAKPTGVSATLSGRKAVISWKKSSRATSYSVYGG
ncbi:MAG: hypothetical protein IJ662_02190, partial [Clostridia bacterium]|nr:hypothetical protein [Clostridia bacterium]